MTRDDGENQGLPVAHPPAENFADAERAAKIGSGKAATEAAMADLAQQLQPADEAEQQSLMLDEMDEQFSLFAGPVKHVASILDGAKRARGRPRGSQNKASRQFAETLMRMGFKHPGLNLAALANASPVGLAIEMACLPEVEGVTAEAHMAAALQSGLLKRSDVVGLMNSAYTMIVKANAELLPYFESKKQPDGDDGGNRPLGNVMVIGQLVMPQAEERKAIDLTRFDAPDE